jgi:hypothetical protein
VPDWLAVLGLAQFRADEHDAALETLRVCDEQHVSQHGGSRPDVWAIMAMIFHQHDETDQAKTALQKASGFLQTPQWQESKIAYDLLREAKQLVLGTDVSPCPSKNVFAFLARPATQDVPHRPLPRPLRLNAAIHGRRFH